jgi:DNA-binding transcriptional LysR family regulator
MTWFRPWPHGRGPSGALCCIPPGRPSERPQLRDREGLSCRRLDTGAKPQLFGLGEGARSHQECCDQPCDARCSEDHGVDPSKATRRFRIAIDNYGAVVLVGILAERVGKAAPQVLLEFVPSGTLKLFDLLDNGELDLANAPSSALAERFSNQVLVHDDFVAVLRKNHPAASARELSIEALAALPHLEISSVRHSTDFVDQALARSKLSRRIALHAPFLSASRILVTSSMTSVLPRRVAEALSLHLPLTIRQLRFPSPIIKAMMIWPRWLDNQPAHSWLRNIISESRKDLSREQH